MNPLANLSARVIAMIVGALLIVGLLLFGVKQCQDKRNMAAQGRVERSQAEAASNSAADAVNAVSASGEAQAASEELSRTNERDIRSAEGANAKVGAGVNAAGRAALCRRAAYRNDPACKGAGR